MKDEAQLSFCNVSELLDTWKTDMLVTISDCEHMVFLKHHKAYIVGILA